MLFQRASPSHLKALMRYDRPSALLCSSAPSFPSLTTAHSVRDLAVPAPSQQQDQGLRGPSQYVPPPVETQLDLAINWWWVGYQVWAHSPVLADLSNGFQVGGGECETQIIFCSHQLFQQMPASLAQAACRGAPGADPTLFLHQLTSHLPNP